MVNEKVKEESVAIESTLNEILKFKYRDFGKIKNPKLYKKFKDKTLIIPERNLLNKKYRHVTLWEESELIRILKHLNSNNNEIGQQFPFIKDLVAIGVNDVHKYEKNEDGTLKILIIKLGCIKGKKFKLVSGNIQGVGNLKKYRRKIFNELNLIRLLSSSGNVRNCKVIFCRKEIYDKVHEILLTGMSKKMEIEKLSKYNSYYGLVSTDSVPVPFDVIGDIAIVSDYVRAVKGTFDIVEDYGNDEYEFLPALEQTEKHIEMLKPFDGAGVIDYSLAKVIAKDYLHLDYIPSSFQFRFLPGCKGNLYVTDIKAFIRKVKIETGKCEIKDCFKKNKVWDMENDKVNIIMTKSQFKFISQYESYDDWKKKFSEETHGYKRTFNISGYGEKFTKLPKIKPLSYQVLQTLQITNEKDIKELCEPTVKMLDKITNNVDEFLKFRGLVDYTIDNEENDVDFEDGNNIKRKQDIPSYYKAMQRCKPLFNDTWIREKIKDDIKGIKNRTCKGGIFLNGCYLTLAPDIFALLQHAFGLEVTGVIGANKVICNYWLDRNKHNLENSKVCIARFPHIAMEWSIADIINPKNKEGNWVNESYKYYRFLGSCIVTGIDSLIPLRANTADFDGDKVICVQNEIIEKAIEAKADWYTIACIEKSNKNDDLDDVFQKPVKYKINNMTDLIATDVKGMSQSIGKVVNCVSKLWNIEVTKKNQKLLRKYICIMSVVASKTIDYAKTGIPARIPIEIQEYLKDIKKPSFMRYVYPDIAKKEKEQNEVNESLGLEKIYKFSDTNTTMNLISKYMESQIMAIDKSVYNSVDSESEVFAGLELFKDGKVPNIAGNVTYPKIVSTLIDLKKEHDNLVKDVSMQSGTEQRYEDDKNKIYTLFYECAKKQLMLQCSNMDMLLNHVIYVFYRDKNFAIENRDKAILWNCFGNEIIRRLKGWEQINSIGDTKAERYIYQCKKINEKIAERKKPKGISNIELLKLQRTTIYKDEYEIIKSIKFLVDGKPKKISKDSRRIAVVVLAFQKLFKINDIDEFRVYKNKKSKVTRTHILRLAGVHHSKWKECVNELKDALNISQWENDESVYLINIPFVLEGDLREEKVWKNIKKIDYLKKICEKI